VQHLLVVVDLAGEQARVDRVDDERLELGRAPGLEGGGEVGVGQRARGEREREEGEVLELGGVRGRERGEGVGGGGVVGQGAVREEAEEAVALGVRCVGFELESAHHHHP
jgi:hypothetical protein